MNAGTRAACVLLCCLSASFAAAQDRAARAPDETAAQPSGDARPPQRPEDAATVATEPEPAPESDPAAPTGDTPTETEVYGPPPPPKWFALKETDADYDACRLALSVLGTVYSQEPPVTDPENRECGIARPVRVTQIIPGIELQGGALMRCDTARALGLWAQDFLRPAATALPGAPRLTALQLGTTYDCRGRIGTGDAAPKLSEHAYGTAIDIAAFVFDTGEPLPVIPREDTGDMSEAFQRAVRGSACLFFTTVLGPGSNEAHSDHLHLDMAQRKGGWRLCQ